MLTFKLCFLAALGWSAGSVTFYYLNLIFVSLIAEIISIHKNRKGTPKE